MEQQVFSRKFGFLSLFTFKESIVLWVFFLLIVCPNLAALNAAFSPKDFEVWIQGGTEVDVSKKAQFLAFSGLRFNDNASNLYLHYGEIGYSYDLNDRWTLCPSYRETYRRINHQWKSEENPRFAATRKWISPRFKLSNRNVVEYRSSNHFFLYRGKLLIEFPHLVSDRITPYLSEEFFLDKFTDLSQNRLACGLYTSLNRHLDGNIGYIFRLTKDSRTWFGYHIIMCYLDLKF